MNESQQVVVVSTLSLTPTLKITASVFTCVSRVEFVLFMIIIYAGCSNINIHKILLSCNWATRKIKMKQRSLLMLNENKIQEYFDIVHLCKIFLRLRVSSESVLFLVCFLKPHKGTDTFHKPLEACSKLN